VDGTAEKVKSLGGSVHIEPRDIPGVGRFAFVADPHGAVFYLMCGDSETDSTAFAPMTTGHGTWNELVTTDQVAAMAFYSALFGWKNNGMMPMGDAGNYTFFGKGDVEMIGGIMDARGPEARSIWNVAFHLADLDAGITAVKSGGGRVLMGPEKLPTSDDVHVRLADPWGAGLILTGSRQEAIA
jgi:hypothetical protein